MSYINIAFGVTNDWLEHTFTVICSVLSNSDNSSEFRFFIMSDIPVEEFNKRFSDILSKLRVINNRFECEYIMMDNSEFDGVVHDSRVGISAYYRLKLGSMVNVDKILYLDSDIVVLKDISTLWNYDTEKFYIGAVEDKYSALMGWRAGLQENEIYINSGVLLMNLKKFREDNLEEKIFEKLREDNNDYSDQDVLNYICKGKILYLPLKYNLMLTVDDENSFPERKAEYQDSLKVPVVLHYSIKPWVIPVQYSEYWVKYHNILV